MSTIDLVLEKILVDMLDIDGVEGVIVVDRDGLVIESAAKKKLDKEAIAGVLHEFAEAINLLGAQFNAGELKTAIIEYANARAFINPIVEGYYLVVIGPMTSTSAV